MLVASSIQRSAFDLGECMQFLLFAILVDLAVLAFFSFCFVVVITAFRDLIVVTATLAIIIDWSQVVVMCALYKWTWSSRVARGK